jgi:predicted enzyme related to lactoylglutathione lyase
MEIKQTGIYVNDQDKALNFYTDILGFLKKLDVRAGNYRWLTVVSPEAPKGVQLVLQPNDNPAAKAYQEAEFKQGMPAIMFFVQDVQKEHARLKERGVKFTMDPMKVTGSTIAAFDDTCGNIVQITKLDYEG